MVDQFEAGKCLHTAFNYCQLGTLIHIIDLTPGQPLSNSNGTNPGAQAESRCKSPGLPRGCWELTDALLLADPIMSICPS